jgi:hypothetical protein
MSNTEIPDYPAYDAPPENLSGLDFNYAVWTEGTKVRLTSVPWDSAYKDISYFSDHAAIIAYLDTKSASEIEITDSITAVLNRPIVLDIGINQAQRFNYLHVHNDAMPVDNDFPNDYFYFVLGAEFESPNATRFILQLDMWATYGHRARGASAYVQRSHLGIANELQFNNFGRDYLTVPEGLDIGGEYQVVHYENKEVMQSFRSNDDEHNGMWIMIVTTTPITIDPGDYENPDMNSAKGSYVQGMPSGAEIYFLKSDIAFINFMTAWSEYPWITQGIMLITGVPKLTRYGYELDLVDLSASDDVLIASTQLYKIKTEGTNNTGKGYRYDMKENWRNSADIISKLPARYQHLKKFFTSPYMMMELTTFSGTPVVMRPELWASANAEINEKASYMPPNQRVVFSPVRYNARPDSEIETSYDGPGTPAQYGDDGGEYLDFGTQIDKFPTFPIVNNMGLSALASTAAGRAYDFRQADWTQERAAGGAATQFGQANAGIENLEGQARTGRSADINSTGITTSTNAGLAALGAVGSLSGGAMTGNPLGVASGITQAATGALGAAMQYEAANQQLGTRVAASMGSEYFNKTQAEYNRDSNQDLAKFTQRGDYLSAIASINARVQDARMIQPSTSGQFGGEAFNLIHGASVLSVRWKLPSIANIRAIGEIWLRYGYAVQQYVRDLPIDWQVMSKFTYWKMTELYIQGDMPEQAKSVIKGIFEKGVTVYADPNDIARIGFDIADNTPKTGIRL